MLMKISGGDYDCVRQYCKQRVRRWIAVSNIEEGGGLWIGIVSAGSEEGWHTTTHREG